MTRLRALVIVVALACGLAARQPAAPPRPILVLVSFDGFRWDYVDRFAPPNLRALARRGVRVRELIPSFPSLTFPNHYTIATGLYPDHHGIVANTIVDPSTPVRFSMSNRDAVQDARWWGGEPIWLTAERNGLRAAPMFWPGSEAPIGGSRPAFWMPFDGKMRVEKRVDQILEWLALPEASRPSFLTLYADDVDHAGHDFGPDSPELRSAVARVDTALGTLVKGVERIGLQSRVDIVVVSDHGMAPLSQSRVVLLDDYVDSSDIDLVEAMGFVALAPRNPDASAIGRIYARLKDASPHLHLYTRETAPARWHYGTNPRVSPIVGVGDAGWAVTTRARQEQRRNDGRKPEAGTHGFDPADRVMHAILIAAGPHVSSHLVVPSLANVDVYNFLCAILKLAPAPNDGDAARVSTWLARSR